jgi:7-keto-8-aminopelargonate synthetase-like enzyme
VHPSPERAAAVGTWLALLRCMRCRPDDPTGIATTSPPTRQDPGARCFRSDLAARDALGLRSHPLVHEAARRAAGAGARSVARLVSAFESELATRLGTQHVLLLPSASAAGFGSVAGAVEPEDHVLIDGESDRVFLHAADSVTGRVFEYAHRDVDQVHAMLAELRARSPHRLLVATDAFFAHDSASPDLVALRAICTRYRAMLLVAAGTDLGTTGARGGGELERQGQLGAADLVTGDLSLALAASSGGFVASSDPELIERVRRQVVAGDRAPLPAVQLARALAALHVVASDEGARLRRRLLANVDALRAGLDRCGIAPIGEPSSVVPVAIEDDAVALRTADLLASRGVQAPLWRSPTRRRSPIRLLLYVTAADTPDDGVRIGALVAGAIREARHASH